MASQGCREIALHSLGTPQILPGHSIEFDAEESRVVRLGLALVPGISFYEHISARRIRRPTFALSKTF
jgi:hypothetical protein